MFKTKCNGMKRDRTCVILYLNKYIVKDIPTYFTTDLIFKNIQSREKLQFTKRKKIFCDKCGSMDLLKKSHGYICNKCGNIK